ncbi:hypothetical protein BGZ76_000726 [Entomortierella beljakovae]|nr:hypothetical protein BGZ76_000726 [Entomortierella beljakovae]
MPTALPIDRLPKAIFLDSGGVINDNSRRGPQWIKLLEEYMPTVLGGPGPLWSRANAILAERLFQTNTSPNVWDQLMSVSDGFRDFALRYDLYWINSSTEMINQYLKEEYEQKLLEWKSSRLNRKEKEKEEEEEEEEEDEPKLTQLVLPESDEDRALISRDAHLHCVSRVIADIPGAVEAILKLKFEQGFDMYTSSGETSYELEITLRALGLGTLGPPSPMITEHILSEMKSEVPLRPVFTTLYGPDLADIQKSSSLYYERVFQHSGIDPRDAVVVDDKEEVLAWAKVHGARTVLISDKNRTGKEMTVEIEEKGKDGSIKNSKVFVVDHQLTSLAELPELTAKWKEYFGKE